MSNSLVPSSGGTNGQSEAGKRSSRSPDSVGQVLLQILSGVASLKLTVVLFALSLMLVFLGTLAQVDQGLWTVLSKYFRGAVAWIPFQVFVRFGQVFFGVSPTAEVAGRFPFPGGWTLGTLLLINLLAAHVTRFRVNWKRSGILLIHSGLLVIMVSELVTGLFAVEGRMSILEKQSSSYTEDYHVMELAIIDSSDSQKDDVVVVPASQLKPGAEIHHSHLPFDIKVNKYMVNSARPFPATPEVNNLATEGDGVDLATVEKSEVSGTDAEQPIDMASAYLTFVDKEGDKSLGTYLLSVWWSAMSDRPQRITAGTKTYKVYLRPKRIYKPYTIHLLEFRHDRYMGTETPRNFSSRVRLVDPEQNEDREVVISMNAPLRYRGETFYQSSVLGEDQGTVLQVVDNPGWLMPYISCAMIALGMLVHFGIHLTGFTRRRLAV